MTLPLDVTPYFTGTDLSYTASGLPDGLAIATTTGVIDGVPTTEGVNAVTVTASNSAGSADQSFTWTILAAATGPAQVTGLGAVAGDGEITLSWAVPADGGSPIADYILERDAGAGFAVIADGTGTGTSFTDTGLTNGTSYTYRVAAVNAVGTGAVSATVSATPQETVSPVASVVQFDVASDPGVGNSYTFPDLAVGSGTVFVGVTRRGGSSEDVSVTSLTIGGQAASQIGEQARAGQTGQRHSFHRLDGVSAGATDIVVDFSPNSPSRCGIVVWTVENAGMTSFVGAETSTSLELSAGIDMAADGVLLAHGMAINTAPGLSFSAGVDQRLAEREVDGSYYDQAGDRAYASAATGVTVTQSATAGAGSNTGVILTLLAVAPA